MNRNFYAGVLVTLGLMIGSYFSLIILTLAFIWLLGLILGLTYQLVLMEKKIQLYSIFEAALEDLKNINNPSKEERTNEKTKENNETRN